MARRPRSILFTRTTFQSTAGSKVDPPSKKLALNLDLRPKKRPLRCQGQPGTAEDALLPDPVSGFGGSRKQATNRSPNLVPQLDAHA